MRSRKWLILIKVIESVSNTLEILANQANSRDIRLKTIRFRSFDFVRHHKRLRVLLVVLLSIYINYKQVHQVVVAWFKM